MENQRGFTLLELMVAVALVAIVVTIATPSWLEFIANRRTKGASRAIYNALQHTRMMAIKEGETVRMIYVDEETPVSGATKDNPECFTRIDLTWDTDNDGDIDDDDQKSVVLNVPESVLCQTPKDTMSYTSRGILLTTNSGRLESSNAYTDRVYSVIVSGLGTIRTE